MDSNSNVVALNEAVLDKYMLDVMDCSNKVKAIFNKMDDLVDKLKSSYVCESATTLFKQYEDLNDNYSIIVNNILSYNTDLMSLKKKYFSNIDDLTRDIKLATENLLASGPKKYEEKR